MSNAALYKGLGAGLGLLAEGMFSDQQRAKDFAAQTALDTADARRRASLEALKRKWRRDDAEFEHGLNLEEIQARSEAEISTEAAKRQIEIENPTPYEQARVAAAEGLIGQREASAETQRARAGLLEVQTEAARRAMNQTQPSEDLFGVVRPDAYTPDSIQAFQDRYEQTGRRQWSLLKPRSGADNQAKIQQEIQERAGEMAEQLFQESDRFGVDVLLYNDPQLAESLGITENTPTPEAVVKVENAFAKSFMQGRQQAAPERSAPGLLGQPINQEPSQGTIPPMGTMPGAGQQQGGIAERAVDAIRRGADPQAVIQRMREAGASEEEIRQVQQAIGDVR